jgi:hypothetical protein
VPLNQASQNELRGNFFEQWEVVFKDEVIVILFQRGIN